MDCARRDCRSDRRFVTGVNDPSGLCGLMSVFGTFETCRLHRAMSAIEGNPEDICSDGVLLSLTRSRRTLDRSEQLHLQRDSRNPPRYQGQSRHTLLIQCFRRCGREPHRTCDPSSGRYTGLARMVDFLSGRSRTTKSVGGPRCSKLQNGSKSSACPSMRSVSPRTILISRS
jgi:hypothetical protein